MLTLMLSNIPAVLEARDDWANESTLSVDSRQYLQFN
jgi:hypothetical protein